MTPAATKNARMEIKTTSDAKELLARAARLDGMDLTAFVMASAMERARKILSEHDAIQLSMAGQLALADLLNAAAAEPTQAMKELMDLPSFSKRGA